MEHIDLGGIAVETLIIGNGPPLLFLHGGDYVAQNRTFLDRLARRWRVVAPRHPGFGATPRPAWFREERDIADIYALPAEEVLRRLFVEPVQVVPDYAKLDDGELLAIARDREATALYGWRPYMHDPALAHWLHRITRPSLVLWGEEDGIVTPAYGELLAAALPNARFERIPQAAHYPQIEQPEKVAAAIERFAQPLATGGDR